MALGASTWRRRRARNVVRVSGRARSASGLPDGEKLGVVVIRVGEAGEEGTECCCANGRMSVRLLASVQNRAYDMVRYPNAVKIWN